MRYQFSWLGKCCRSFVPGGASGCVNGLSATRPSSITVEVVEGGIHPSLASAPLGGRRPSPSSPYFLESRLFVCGVGKG